MEQYGLLIQRIQYQVRFEEDVVNSSDKFDINGVLIMK